ncbi:unnamed protein product [Rotaria sp. Silwood1]|nr:unnamed protein product [Rotaria sp. Silwood1]CAF4735410.1 unnamed protein product [Rotaria sp. Silwood1]CAF4857123.1 unnamed protein product [Rotaria sp. Silwood1]
MVLQAFALYSLFTVCFLSFDQYLSTNVRSSWRQKSTLKLAHLLTSLNVCFVVLHSSTVLIIYEIQPSMSCNVYNPIARRYYSFFYYPILANILPVVLTVTLSLLAYRNVRRIVRLQLPVFRRRLDRQMTAMTLARVMVLIIFGFPYIIISQYAVNLKISGNNYMEIAIVSLLSAIFASIMHANFTVNFYVFLIVSSRFRRQVKTILMKKCCRSIKRCFNKAPTNIRMNQISPGILLPSVSISELE